MLIVKSLGLAEGSLTVAEPQSERGTFSGYASTFGNVDRDDDIVERGAFKSVSAPKTVKLLWQHRHEAPIGVWKTLREDDKGLYVEGELNLAVQKAREAHALMKQGAIDSLSIGFRIPKGGASYEESKADGANEARRIRRIKQVTLHEISVVSIPANTLATIGSVKSVSDMTEREFEALLRDAGGLSRKEAQIVVAEGFRSLVKSRTTGTDPQRDADQDPNAELAAHLAAMLADLKSPTTP